MDHRGWVPAGAGNISVRLDETRLAITRSGGHKGFLDAGSVMQVDIAGTPLTVGAKPSAETLLHCQIYRLHPKAGAVLHGHSVASTVLSMALTGPIRLSGYEVLKAFGGLTTHDTSVDLPIFDNDQDISRLAKLAEPTVAAGAPLGYSIRGHGVYIWGPDMNTAMARLEGLEFLLACELAARSLRP